MLSVQRINHYSVNGATKSQKNPNFTSGSKILLNTGEEILEDKFKTISNMLITLRRENIKAFYSLAKNTLFPESEKIQQDCLPAIFKSGLYNTEQKLSEDAIKVIKAITKVKDDAIKFVDAVTGL